MNTSLQHKKIYLDYASSTPVDEEVLTYMNSIQTGFYGNAQAIHSQGRDAAVLLDTARKTVAEALHAHTDEIIFTSGGTESDNIAIMGVVLEYKKNFPNRVPHILVSSIEHPAVIEVVLQLQKLGIIELDAIPVDAIGIVDVSACKKLIKDNTILVSVIHANNEIGTIQPVEEIAKVIRHYKKHRTEVEDSLTSYPLFHTDACQSFVYEKIKVESLGVDLLTINSSKIYGPKGAGALFIKRRTPIHAVFFGGSQENHIRPGTENVPLIASFAKAISINEASKESESSRIALLRDQLKKGLEELFPELIYNGDATHRLPNNMNITIPGIKSEQLVIYADSFGIALSEKSACKTDVSGLSHVILALRQADGKIQTEEEGSIRFSLGKMTTDEDIKEVLLRFKEIKALL